MKLEDVRTLHTLADAKYQARQQRFQKLLARENVVRAELVKLGEREAAANATNDPNMRAIGADVIWKSWLGRARVSLNMKLALIMAEKEQHLRQVREAYGKVLASEALVNQLSVERLDKKRKHSLMQAIDMALFTVPEGDTK
ncbi:hypothetical protein [Roseobacter sp.]|uniref:hypothetical protein n=1 Tax=Roseobacter sp. TaxID=1907202 RepID=UPI003298BBCD